MNRTRLVRGVMMAAYVAATVASLSSQAPPSTPGNAYTPPRTPWGDPDLQGIWPGTDMVSVPFERPAQFGNRLFLTEEEFKAREAQAAKQQNWTSLDFDLREAARRDRRARRRGWRDVAAAALARARPAVEAVLAHRRSARWQHAGDDSGRCGATEDRGRNLCQADRVQSATSSGLTTAASRVAWSAR